MVDLRGLRARDVWLEDVDITGDVENLRHQRRRRRARSSRPSSTAATPTGPRCARPTRPASARHGTSSSDSGPATVERARSFAPEQLHERVDGEWSFIETLRHLVFATDAWVAERSSATPSRGTPLDLPHDDMPDSPPVPRDRDARPSLDEVLALRADRMATVRRVVDGLTDEPLAGTTEPVTAAGYPEPRAVCRDAGCLRTILNEEWQHRLYAERDLDALAAREDSGVDSGVDAGVDAELTPESTQICRALTRRPVLTPRSAGSQPAPGRFPPAAPTVPHHHACAGARSRRCRRHQEVPVADLGWPELSIIALAVVLLFGWKRMPDMARSLGRSARIFKSEVDQMRSEPDATAGPAGSTTARPSGSTTAERRRDLSAADDRVAAADAEVARLRAELEARRHASGSH